MRIASRGSLEVLAARRPLFAYFLGRQLVGLGLRVLQQFGGHRHDDDALHAAGHALNLAAR